MKTRFVRILTALSAIAIICHPQKAAAIGACTCARFNDFKDHGCPKKPTGVGGEPAWANKAGGNQANCPTCPPPNGPALAGPDASDASQNTAIGMPRWWVNEPYINLHVVDEPLSYTMSSGQQMVFRFNYKQDYKLPQPDQIPTFYNTYFDVSRDLDQGPGIDGGHYLIGPYIHAMQSFAGAYSAYSGSFQEMTNGMTNAAWMHNWNEFIILWDKQWETEYFEAGGTGWLNFAPYPYSDTYEALAFMPDGGAYYFTFNATNQSLNASNQSSDPVSRIQIQSSPSSYPTPYYTPVADANGNYWGNTTNTITLSYPDGSRDVFGLNAWNGPGPPAAPDTTAFALLTERIDQQGRLTRLGYRWDSFTNQCDGQAYSFFRLHYVVDPDGGTNTFVYSTSSPTMPSQLQEIDDPFGRKATFSYAGCGAGAQRGWMTGITDAQGNNSSFAYQSGNNGWMSSLITPYGTNSFYFAQVAESDVTNGYQQRGIYVTEPAGASQLFCYIHNASSAIEANATPPTVTNSIFDDGLNGGSDEALYHRNTFYWDRKQTTALSTNVTRWLPSSLNSAMTYMASSTAELQKGRMQHWLLDSDGISITETLSSERDPSPDSGGTIEGERTWYSYGNSTLADQYASNGVTSDNVAAIATLLPDGSSSYTRYVYGQSSAPWLVTQNAQSYTQPNGSVGELANYFTYNSPNFIDVVSISNSLGQYLHIGYNGAHEITSITNALSQIATLAYNSSTLNLTSIASYTGQTISLTYYSSFPPYLDQITNQPENKVTTVAAYTGPNPRIIHVTGSGLPDLWKTNSWDSLNRLTGSVYQDGTTFSNVYTCLDITAQKDRLGNWTSYTYDGLQHLTTITDARSNVTQFTWCDCGSLTSISNALNNTTSLYYNNQELLTNVSFPDGSSLKWQFDLMGRVTNRFDGAGDSLQYAYNNQSLLTSINNSYGQLWGCYRDAVGRIASATNINNVAVTNAYDFLNRLTNRAWTGGGTENFGYSSNGLVAYTNQDFQWTHFGRDGAGRMTALTNAVQTESFGWNALDELASLTDGLNHTTTWAYNQYGWLTNKANTLGTNIIVYAYDADGHLTNRWMMGTNTGYTYDAVGNLKTILYPALTITNFYDAINELTNMLDAVGMTKFAYTQIGQLASETGPWTSDTVSYTYTQGHRSGLSLSQPSGSWGQTYSYDAEWRMSGLATPAGPFTYGYAANASPLIRTISLPNAASITNTYDGLAHLTSTALQNYWGHTLDGYAYGLDTLGLRTNLTRQFGLVTNGAALGYDGIGELTNWSGTNGNGHLRHNEQLAYAYDAGGNLNVRTNDALVQTFSVDAINQLSSVSRAGAFTEIGSLPAPTSGMTVNGGGAAAYLDMTFAATGLTLNNGVNIFTNVAQNAYGFTVTNIVTANLPTPVTFQYDANGNLTNDGTRSFQYDAENQLTNVYVATAWQVGFVYDGLNRRRIERDYTWNGTGWMETNEIRLVYDGLLPIQERDTNNNPATTYTRGLDLTMTRTGGGGIGGLLARTDSTGSYYYHSDGGGNITALMDGYQRIVARYLYDPYGKLLGKWGSKSDINRYRFSSKEFIPQAGISYYGLRFYEPNFQRWLNRDPIGEAGGINLYQAVGNNPVNRIDPFGLSWLVSGTPFAPGQQGTYGPYAYYLNDGRNDIIPANEYPTEDMFYGGLQGAEGDFLLLGGLYDGLAAAGRFGLDLAESGIKAAGKCFAKSAPKAVIPDATKAVSPAVRNAMYNGGIESVSQAEREAAAAYYDLMAQTAKGDAARALNAARANYARYGGTPPGGIGNFQP